MWDNFFRIEFDEHLLDFNGLTLECAQYEPEGGCFYDVQFSYDYFISSTTGDKVEITTNYRGLKGTAGYQVELFIEDQFVKAFMIQTTPMGDILTPKGELYI